ncbi:hypothetical protein [Ureaplasma canigenitalium]|uniref:hypothetical protein n=1 Tax=Ureaplasma canigenitalium TaxID=42092 RepID=UPI0004E2547E|nr:hypothetical protein [Ureaplasma canigenitalium]
MNETMSYSSTFNQKLEESKAMAKSIKTMIIVAFVLAWVPLIAMILSIIIIVKAGTLKNTISFLQMEGSNMGDSSKSLGLFESINSSSKIRTWGILRFFSIPFVGLISFIIILKESSKIMKNLDAYRMM